MTGLGDHENAVENFDLAVSVLTPIVGGEHPIVKHINLAHEKHCQTNATQTAACALAHRRCRQFGTPCPLAFNQTQDTSPLENPAIQDQLSQTN